MARSVLIAGGTGFLGKHLALALKEEFNVVLAGRNHIQNMSAQLFAGCEVAPLDVTNIESVRDVFARIRPDIVIHAAATKFVDLAELHPMEAIDVNVLGSQNVARVCIEKGVEAVVGMSTDKAAPPVANTYGLSKSLMERLFCSMNDKTETRFACVRFGNIMWSSGSAFPVWLSMQEKEGTIVSVGPEMTRYFLTVDEAVELVRTALSNLQEVQGRVLCRAMKARRIKDILNLWVEHRGGRWVAGPTRSGERPYEYLVGASECGHAREEILGGESHYLIDFNNVSASPLPAPLSSETAPQLTDEEVLSAILKPPRSVQI